jgi:hypothetical protein
MKYLSNYIQEKQTKLFDEIGAFFAFSKEQFDEQKKEGVVYIGLRMGLLCPKGKVKKLFDGIDMISEQGRAEDLAENGRENVIKRELENYECYYVCDPSEAIEALEPYGITKSEVVQVYRNNRQNYE